MTGVVGDHADELAVHILNFDYADLGIDAAGGAVDLIVPEARVGAEGAVLHVIAPDEGDAILVCLAVTDFSRLHAAPCEHGGVCGAVGLPCFIFGGERTGDESAHRAARVRVRCGNHHALAGDADQLRDFLPRALRNGGFHGQRIHVHDDEAIALIVFAGQCAGHQAVTDAGGRAGFKITGNVQTQMRRDVDFVQSAIHNISSFIEAHGAPRP